MVHVGRRWAVELGEWWYGGSIVVLGLGFGSGSWDLELDLGLGLTMEFSLEW